MSILVQLIVGELEFVERDHLFHPGSARRRRVWMDVNARWGYGISLPGDHPARAAIKRATAAALEKHQIYGTIPPPPPRWINKQLPTYETHIGIACRPPAQSPSALCSWPVGRVRRFAPGT